MNEIDLYSQPSYSDSVKLYHHTKNSHDTRIMEFKFRDAPSNTPIVVHDLVNHYAVQKFGLPVRNLFFTYAEYMFANQMRAIPLGDNVRYFYNPDVDDMTALILIEKYKEVEEFLLDIKDQYDYQYDVDEMANLFGGTMNTQKTLKGVVSMLSKRYSDIIDNGDDIAKKVVAFFIKHIKEYVEGIIEVDVIDDIPPDTDSEIMVYAPDDIYLISSHKKDP